MKARFNRRQILRGTGGMALALPMLASWPRRTGAQSTAGTLTRFIAYCQPLGTFGEEFWPNPVDGSRYVYDPRSSCSEGPRGRCRAKEFRTGENALEVELTANSTILEPILARHRSRTLVLENLNNARGNHGGYSSMLTGSTRDGRGPSIDQALIPLLGQRTPFPSLHFGVRSSVQIGDRFCASWYDAHRGVAPSSNPRAVYERIFSDVGTEPDAAAQVLATRRSILDAARDGARRLRTQISGEDAERVDQYFDAVRDLELRLSQLPSGEGCFVPETPLDDANSTNERRNLAIVPEVARAQVDLLAVAMACDLTRVATFQMAFEATNMTHPWLDVEGRWHDLSHNGGSGDGWQDTMRSYVEISRWNAELIARLVDRLVELGSMSGTALLWINPMNNGQVHNGANIPVALISEDAGLKTGRHLRLERNGHRVNDLHTALFSAAGQPRPRFGDEEHNRRPLTELLG